MLLRRTVEIEKEKKLSSKTVKPVYDDGYDKKLAESLEKIKNRAAFRYDAKSDPLYDSYKSEYIAQGKAAMRDTMGQAASLTGGYASSYAETAGQQSYNKQLEKLGNVIPQLYELAYSRYENEGKGMWDDFNALKKLRDSEYERYSDELDEYEAAQELEYKHAQDERKQSESEAAAKAKYGDFSGYAALYGSNTAENMKNNWISENPKTAYNMGLIDASKYYSMTGSYAPGFELPQPDKVSGTKSSVYYPNTAPDGRDAKVVQRELRNMGYNIAVDGAWGPKSQAAWEKVYGKSGWFTP